jgi:large subunit ribosomal protein L13
VFNILILVVINARHVKFTGNKEKDKRYTWHTGYPGGLKTISPMKLREDRPEEVKSYFIFIL